MARRDPDSRLELPPLELACMQALWVLGQGTVHDIRARLFPARPRAYTTVMTVMDRLAQKGVATRLKHGRAHLYIPAIDEEEVRRHALGQLVKDFFQGSREHLRDYLTKGSKPPAAPVGVTAGLQQTAEAKPTAAEENA